MKLPCDALSTALDAMREDFSCTPTGDPSTVLVTTGRHYADGEPVEVFVRISEDGDRIVVSDGGLTRARRHLFGLGAPSGHAQTLWEDITSDFGARETGDRIYVRGPFVAATNLIAGLADALLTLDGVRHLSQTSVVTFTDQVRTWLRDELEVTVEPGRTVVDKLGEEQKVTAIVTAPDRRVIIQAASSGSGAKAAAKSAFWVMGGLSSEWPMTSRLIILGSVKKDDPLVPRLTEVAYVSTMDRAFTVRRFLKDGAPPVRDLATQSFGQIEIEIDSDKDETKEDPRDDHGYDPDDVPDRHPDE